MRMYRLLMPAVTVAGALALAGCGGGSSTPGAPPPPPMPLEVEPGKESRAIGGFIYECPENSPENCKVDDVSQIAAEYEDAGFTRTPVRGPAVPPSDETVSRLFDVADGHANANYAFSRGTVSALTIADGKVTGTFDRDRDGSGNDEVSTEVEVEETGTVATINGWKGKRYVGTHGGSDDDNNRHTAVIYDNKGSPKLTPFIAWVASNNAIALVAASGDVPAHVAQSDFTDGEVKGFGDPTLRAKTYKMGENVSGTFEGASGSYRCNDTECTSNGNATLSDSDWIFVPAANAMVSEADEHYLRFGWWLQEENPPSDWANLATFVDMTASAETVVAAVDDSWVGKATYEGAAAGLVAISRGSGQSGNLAGEFTANATLEADFKTTEGGTVSGTIDGFMVDGRPQGWVVKLLESGTLSGSDAFGKTRGGDPYVEGGTTWAMTSGGDPDDANGGWSGNFYNEGNAADPEPDSVAGTFQARYQNIGAMQGAFGASEKK